MKILFNFIMKFLFFNFLKIADFLEIDKIHFSKERFQQRSDGYYCILKPNRYYNVNVTKLKCLGDNKGRSAKKDRIKKYTHKNPHKNALGLP